MAEKVWTKAEREAASIAAKARYAEQQAAKAAEPDPVAENYAEDRSDEELLQSVAVEEPDADEAEARRQRLVGDLDPEVAALFSDDELALIEAEEQKKALEDQRKQALTSVRALARQQARIEHDLIPASQLRTDAEKKRLNEPVTFIVRLPGDGAGHRGQNGIRVDGQLYQDGRTYTRPRAIFESIMPNIYRAWLTETQFRTLDQHKQGNSAAEVLGRTMPQIELH